MEPFTITALALLLAASLGEAGKTLATESVKLALEKRQDITNAFVGLFRPDEIISLRLNEPRNIDEAQALLAANPDVQARIESNPDLLKELLVVIKEQAGASSSQTTINAKNVGQVINNPTGDVIQNNNNWS